MRHKHKHESAKTYQEHLIEDFMSDLLEGAPPDAAVCSVLEAMVTNAAAITHQGISPDEFYNSVLNLCREVATLICHHETAGSDQQH